MAVDATGKVKGSGSVLEDAVLITRSTQGGTKTGKQTQSSGADGASVLDQVDVRLANTLTSAIDPEKLSAERKEKVAKLKELIATGQYRPSAEVIARSVADEISQEIFFAQGNGE